MKSIRQKRLAYAIEKISLRLGKRPTTGWTEFAPLRVPPEYIDVNAKMQRVTGVVRYRGTVHLTVEVDVAAGETKVIGNVRRIKKEIKPFTKRKYVDMIEDEARFLVGRQEIHKDHADTGNRKPGNGERTDGRQQS